MYYTEHKQNWVRPGNEASGGQFTLDFVAQDV